MSKLFGYSGGKFEFIVGVGGFEVSTKIKIIINRWIIVESLVVRYKFFFFSDIYIIFTYNL